MPPFFVLCVFAVRSACFHFIKHRHVSIVSGANRILAVANRPRDDIQRVPICHCKTTRFV